MAGNPDERALPEWEIHAEHAAALDATLFQRPGEALVFELCDGHLRLADRSR